MPVEAKCPCGWAASVPDAYAGKRGKCPKCGLAIAIAPAPAAGVYGLVPEPEAPNPQRVRPVAGGPTPAVPEPSPTFAATTNVNVVIADQRAEGRRANVVGIVSLVFGAIALSVCWVPFFGMVAIPLGALATVLGIAGLVVALVARRSGIGSPIAGAVIGAAAVAGSIAVTGAAANAVGRAVEEANRPGPVAAAAPAAAPAPIPPAAAEPPPLAAPEAPDFVVAPEWAELDDCRVRVASVGVMPAEVRDEISGVTSKTGEPYLLLAIEVANSSRSRKSDYRTWGVGPFPGLERRGTMRDNFGNTYKPIRFAVGEELLGRTDAASVYPGKSAWDVLAFEAPIDGVEYLELELPGDNVGVEGLFRIRIHPDSITRK